MPPGVRGRARVLLGISDKILYVIGINYEKINFIDYPEFIDNCPV
jgi:hypothetical protein